MDSFMEVILSFHFYMGSETQTPGSITLLQQAPLATELFSQPRCQSFDLFSLYKNHPDDLSNSVTRLQIPERIVFKKNGGIIDRYCIASVKEERFSCAIQELELISFCDGEIGVERNEVFVLGPNFFVLRLELAPLTRAAQVKRWGFQGIRQPSCLRT